MWSEPSVSLLKKMPNIYSTDHIPVAEKTIHLHFFVGGCDWYIAEYDGDVFFWGFAILNNDMINAKWGLIPFSVLKSINIHNIEVDRDIYWRPCVAKNIKKINRCSNW